MPVDTTSALCKVAEGLAESSEVQEPQRDDSACIFFLFALVLVQLVLLRDSHP
jgi:hypothetical protein